MSRFHFNIYDEIVVLDEDGTEFSNLAAAREAAVCGAREMMAAQLLAGEPITRHHRIDIADESGTVVASLPFGEVMTIRA